MNTTPMTTESYRDCRNVLLAEIAMRKHGRGPEKEKMIAACRKGLAGIRESYYRKGA